MLSLPLIIPRDDRALWPLPTTYSHRPSSPPPLHQNQPPQNSPPSPNHPSHHRHARPQTTLSILQADEAVLAARKLNIARFGATWIRPPGIPKTYQAAMDEAIEREEQEMISRREQAMLELAQAQEAAEEETRRNEMIARAEADEEAAEGEVDLDAEVPELGFVDDMSDVGEEEEDEEELEDVEDGEDDEEHDLDADLPEGSALGGSISGTEGEEDSVSEEASATNDSNIHEDADPDADVTFNEDSMYNDNSLLSPTTYPHPDAENTYTSPRTTRTFLARQEAELSGALQDERDLNIDPDLDDAIPEAGSGSYLDNSRSFIEGGSYIEGSYQHTDTELDSEDEANHDDPDGSSSFVSTGPGAPLNLRASVGRMQARSNAAAAHAAAVSSMMATSDPALALPPSTSTSNRALRHPDPFAASSTARGPSFPSFPPFPASSTMRAPPPPFNLGLGRLDLNRRPRESIDTEGQSSFHTGDDEEFQSSMLASSPAMGRGAGAGAGAGVGAGAGGGDRGQMGTPAGTGLGRMGGVRRLRGREFRRGG